VVKLEVKREGPPFYSHVERTADGAIRTWVDLSAAAQDLGSALDVEIVTDAQPLSPACRQAVRAIFAQVSERIRGVRGVLHESPAARAGFEMQLPATSSGEQLADGLAALSIACLFAGPEIQLLLSDPFIAESYLGQRSAAGALAGGRGRHGDRR
jgi:hypothetical protein